MSSQLSLRGSAGFSRDLEAVGTYCGCRCYGHSRGRYVVVPSKARAAALIASSKRQLERLPGKRYCLWGRGLRVNRQALGPSGQRRGEERLLERSRRSRDASAPAAPLSDSRASARSARRLGCAETRTHSCSRGQDHSSVSQGQRPRPRGFLSPLTQCKDLHPDSLTID